MSYVTKDNRNVWKDIRIDFSWSHLTEQICIKQVGGVLVRINASAY